MGRRPRRRPRRRRPEVLAASASFRLPEAARVFEELPRKAIVAVSRPDAGDITPYTIEANYKQTNTMIYQDVFSCVPNDPIHSRTQFRQSFAHWRDKIGHTTIDLGVAQEKLETYQDSNLKGTDPMERLQLVRGHLVSFPLDIMCEEDLRPYFSENEYYTSPQVFH